MAKLFKQLIILVGFTFVLTACQEENIEGVIHEARLKMGAKEFKEAISLLNGVLVVDKENAAVLNMRAVARIELGQFAKAIKDLDKAIVLDKRNYKFFYNRGNVKRKVNKPKDALEDYSMALSLDSSQYEVWLNRALCHTAVGQSEAALADFGGALNNGGRKDAQVNFYHGKMLIGLGKYQSAIEALETTVAIDNTHAAGHYMLGLAQLGAGGDVQQRACLQLEKALNFGHPEASEAIQKYCQ